MLLLMVAVSTTLLLLADGCMPPTWRPPTYPFFRDSRSKKMDELRPRNLFDVKSISPFEEGLKKMFPKRERDEANAFGDAFNLTKADAFQPLHVLMLETRGTNDTKKCLADIKCSDSSECGESGKCIFNKCRCECIPKSACLSDDDCFGSPCNDTCSKYAGFIHDECNVEDHCARGTQCLMGACVGGGRFHDGMYDAVSCSPVSAAFDCDGIGTGLCAMIGNICIRHKDPAHLGLIADDHICKGGVIASVGFPTCVSAQGNATTCGLGNTCMLGSQCGSCSCN